MCLLFFLLYNDLSKFEKPLRFLLIFKIRHKLSQWFFFFMIYIELLRSWQGPNYVIYDKGSHRAITWSLNGRGVEHRVQVLRGLFFWYSSPPYRPRRHGYLATWSPLSSVVWVHFSHAFMFNSWYTSIRITNNPNPNYNHRI